MRGTPRSFITQSLDFSIRRFGRLFGSDIVNEGIEAGFSKMASGNQRIASIITSARSDENLETGFPNFHGHASYGKSRCFHEIQGCDAIGGDAALINLSSDLASPDHDSLTTADLATGLFDDLDDFFGNFASERTMRKGYFFFA